MTCKEDESKVCTLYISHPLERPSTTPLEYEILEGSVKNRKGKMHRYANPMQILRLMSVVIVNVYLLSAHDSFFPSCTYLIDLPCREKQSS